MNDVAEGFEPETFDADPTPDRRSGFHPVNLGHLVMGVAFLGLASIWWVYDSEVVTGDDLRWLLPLPWLAAGAFGLGAMLVSSRRRRAGETSEADDPMSDFR